MECKLLASISCIYLFPLTSLELNIKLSGIDLLKFAAFSPVKLEEGSKLLHFLLSGNPFLIQTINNDIQLLSAFASCCRVEDFDAGITGSRK